MFVAIPISDSNGLIECVYGPFDTLERAEACAARLSIDPKECKAVEVKDPWPELAAVLSRDDHSDA